MIPGVIPVKAHGLRGSTRNCRPVGLELREVLPGLKLVAKYGGGVAQCLVAWLVLIFVVKLPCFKQAAKSGNESKDACQFH